MTPDEGLDWAHRQTLRDPRWADTEMTIRRTAMEIQDKLSHEGQIDVTIPVIGAPPGYGSFRMIRVRSQIRRMGGVEELLLIEEQLRRAMRDTMTVAVF